MGTNYYLHEKPPCGDCGRGYKPLHIGKSSGGWCFSLHAIPDEGLTSLDAWDARIRKLGVEVLDEYGRFVSPDEMISIITERSWFESKFAGRTREFLDQNHAEDGPNGLLRHRLDGRHCVGHGAGTYDLIAGEFS